jgi:hypothetical protein
MPLVKIDLIRGTRSKEEVRLLADVVQEVMLAYLHAPPRDRYQVLIPKFRIKFPSSTTIFLVLNDEVAELRKQIITQHESGELICEDTNLGIERSENLVILHIFQQGRSVEVKQATFAALAKNLGEKCGLMGEDLIISCAENTKNDW